MISVELAPFHIACPGRGSSTPVSKTTGLGVRRAKAAFSQWVRGPPGDIAPAGSNRSSYGGNEIAEAFDVTVHFR